MWKVSAPFRANPLLFWQCFLCLGFLTSSSPQKVQLLLRQILFSWGPVCLANRSLKIVGIKSFSEDDHPCIQRLILQWMGTSCCVDEIWDKGPSVHHVIQSWVPRDPPLPYLNVIPHHVIYGEPLRQNVFVQRKGQQSSHHKIYFFVCTETAKNSLMPLFKVHQ